MKLHPGITAILIFLGLVTSHLATAWAAEGVVNFSDVSPAQYGIAIATSLGAAITKFLAKAEPL